MKGRLLLALTISIFFGISPIIAADGDLDTTFGFNGAVLTFEAGLGGAADIAVQSDDKIIVISRKNDGFAVYRFNPDGSADATFGNGGEVVSGFSTGAGTGIGQDDPRAVAIQPNGKIVVAGSTNRIPGGLDFALARLNSDGTLDTSFGTGGRVHTDFSSRDDVITDIAIEGKMIVALGTTTQGSNTKFALARYRRNGSLDQSFSTNGKRTIGFGSGFNFARGVAVQPDGKIVVAGTEHELCNGGNLGHFALARVLVNGTLDPSFGVNGKETTSFDACAESQVYAVSIQPNGQIVAAGTTNNSLFGQVWALARYNGVDGSLDTTFGTDGKTIAVSYDTMVPGGGPRGLRAMIIDQGQIIVGGDGMLNFCLPTGASSTVAMLMRFDSSGNRDLSFGPTDPSFPGLVFYSPLATDCPNRTEFTVNSIALQSDGKIVTAGMADQGPGTLVSVALARFLN